MTDSFADRLADAVTSKDSCLVVGLDPVLEKLPRAVVAAAEARSTELRARAAAAIVDFNTAVIELVAPYACAVKPQVAFYEQWGPDGLAAYEQTIALARAAGLLVIGDVKRGDIGSTAAAYARAHLHPSPVADRADAITINPYLGTDSVTPFLDAVSEHGAGLFVLVRTSNPSARDLQDLVVPDGTLHEAVARLVDRWGEASLGRCGYNSVGAVVGATAPEHLQRLREMMPRSWFLVPGVGAQGGSAEDIGAAFDSAGLGAVVNSSRGILYAFGDPTTADWRTPIERAARELRDALRAVAHSGAAPRSPA